MKEFTTQTIAIQLALFRLIAAKHTPEEDWVNDSRNLLKIEMRPLKNRINGSTQLTMKELLTLSKYYSITLDDIEIEAELDLRVKWKNTLCSPLQESKCPHSQHSIRSMPVLDENLEGIANHIDAVILDLSTHSQAERISMKTIYTDLPLFYTLPYKELFYFMLYSYYHHLVSKDRSYEDFVDMLADRDIEQRFLSLKSIYDQAYCQEIWTNDILNNTLQILKECMLHRKIKSKNNFSLIMKQLDTLITHVEELSTDPNRQTELGLELRRLNTVRPNGFTLIEDSNGNSRLINQLFMLDFFVTSNPNLLISYQQIYNTTLAGSDLFATSSNAILAEYFNGLRDKLIHFKHTVNLPSM
ncbi:hypothetical protein [Sphingobacterium faecale]|uniref:BetR domain-containing protein n=1 Tax=Sphingobacterium faecale TaxID=2803775 RepID=A0ABS1R1W7_9SPHI|nr:hypothetical protein [Sphingobacterium faecale]MBL1408688.1 hypothetical protein [Sphingobacterium faecale]